MAIKFDESKGRCKSIRSRILLLCRKDTAFIFKRTYVGKKNLDQHKDIVKRYKDIF